MHFQLLFVAVVNQFVVAYLAHNAISTLHLVVRFELLAVLIDVSDGVSFLCHNHAKRLAVFHGVVKDDEG